MSQKFYSEVQLEALNNATVDTNKFLVSDNSTVKYRTGTEVLSDIGAISSVTATSPITSTGGTTPVISTSMATNKLIGRSTAGTGVMEEITIGSGLALSGGTLSSSGSPSSILHGTAAGTDTYTVTIAGATAYADGDAYLVRFTNGNTTGATLNINSLGAIPLYRNNDGAVIGGDIWAGAEMLCIYNSTITAFQCIGTSSNSLFAYVTNADSVAITKGQPVYAFGGTGDRLTVKRAFNTSDAGSARTIGVVLTSSIAVNQKGIIIIEGLLDGLNILPTSTWADGDTVYLGTTAGSITNVKQYAPNHLVYLGTVTTASNGSSGRWYVRVQNGYELDELHNVQAQTPSLKDTLWYDNTVSPAQWKTASIPTILGYTPANASGTTNYVSKFTGTTTLGNSLIYDNGTNVGIGTTSPSGKLDVISGNIYTNGEIRIGSSYAATGTAIIKSNSGVLSLFTWGDSTNIQIGGNDVIFKPEAGSERMRLTSTGNLGIGTSSPSEKLVVGSLGGGVKRIYVPGTYNFDGSYLSNYDSNGGGKLELVAHTGVSNSASWRIANNNDTYGQSLTFSYAPNTTSYSGLSYSAPAMLIANTGNVGIGNTSPTNKLIVDSNVNSADGIVCRNLTTGTSGYTFVGAFNNANNGVDLRSFPSTNSTFPSTSFVASSSGQTGGLIISQAGANPIRFNINGSEQMRITSAGNVGIGTSSPGVRFVNSGGGFSSGPTLGSGIVGSQALLSNNGLYGLYSGVSSNGDVWQQVQRNDANTAVYNLALQPSGGNIYIGTTAPIYGTSSKMQFLFDGLSEFGINFRSTAVASIPIHFTSSTGTQTGYIFQDATGVFLVSVSDYRLKEDLNSFNGLDLISKINVYDYKWKGQDKRSFGVMAHELQEVIPQAAFGEKDGERMQGVDYSTLVPILIQAIKEQQTQIEELKILINK